MDEDHGFSFTLGQLMACLSYVCLALALFRLPTTLGRIDALSWFCFLIVSGASFGAAIGALGTRKRTWLSVGAMLCPFAVLLFALVTMSWIR